MMTKREIIHTVRTPCISTATILELRTPMSNLDQYDDMVIATLEERLTETSVRATIRKPGHNSCEAHGLGV